MFQDLKRMKCLYRNTPDVARHAMAAPEVRAQTVNNASTQAQNARNDGEVRVVHCGYIGVQCFCSSTANVVTLNSR